MRRYAILLFAVALAPVPSCGKDSTAPPPPAYGTSWRKVADVSEFRRWAFGNAVFGGRLWVMGGWEVGGGIQTSVYSSANGVTWSTQPNSGIGNAMEEFPAFVHDAGAGNELWAAGNGSVRHSSDGYAWTLAADVTATMGTRRGQMAVSFDPDGVGGNPASMYLIAGSNGSTTYYADVWTSAAGGTWTSLVASAAFAARWDGVAVVFSNRIWLIGGATNGYAADSYLNDVWSSPDGINWTLATAHAGFSPRMLHSAFVYGDKIWVIGGRATDDGVTVKFENDVWNSRDGVTWTEVTGAAAFAPRMGHACLVHDDGTGSRIWLIGGYDEATDSLAGEVWRAE